MDILSNILFVILIGFFGVISEFLFLGYYSPTDRDKIPHFITGEKQKAFIGLIIGAGVMIYFAAMGKINWYPLCVIAFSMGSFAVAKHKERKTRI
jgi:hypothetical protein